MRLYFVASLLVLTGIAIASNIYTLLPIYSDIANDLEISIDRTVIASSIFSFFYAVGLLSFGPISEKLGRKRVIVAGLLLSGITTVAVGLSFNDWSLYLSRGVQGVALASFAPVAFSYTFDLFETKPRTLVLSLINSGFLMAGIIGQLASSLITSLYEWGYVFYIFGGIYFTLFLIGMFIFPSDTKKGKSQKRILIELLRLVKKPLLLRCYSITFTLLLVFVAFYDGLGRFLTELNIEPNTVFAIRAVGLIGAILSLFTGKIIKLYGEKRTLLFGLSLTTISLLIILINKSLNSIAIVSIVFVASISLLLPSIITFIGNIGGDNRASAISIYSFTLLTGASIGPIFASIFRFNSLIVCLIGLFVLNMIIGSQLKS